MYSMTERMHSAGLVIYVQKEREMTYLVLKNKWKPGFSFPKGLIQKDESPIAAAIRETQEETGLTVDDYILSSEHHDVTVSVEKTRRFGDGIKRIRFFFARLVSEKKDDVLSREHSAFFWLRSGELGILQPQMKTLVLENEEDLLSRSCDVVF